MRGERGCGRFEWSVLDWNESPIGRSLAAFNLAPDDWLYCQLQSLLAQTPLRTVRVQMRRAT